MNPILEYLRTNGESPAAKIRHSLGMSHEAVYAVLVRLEADEEVTIKTRWPARGIQPERTWSVV